MTSFVEGVLGLALLVGICWGALALWRLLQPRPRLRSESLTASGGRSAPARGTAPVVDEPSREARVRPCCPDCTPGCQITGLVLGQAGDRGHGWWDQPFGEDGPNVQAMTFWGDECCPGCGGCSICQDASGP